VNARRRPPRELTHYDPRAWIPPGRESDPDAPKLGYRAWCAARAAWVSDGNQWPGGESVRHMGEQLLNPNFGTIP
jgi:hypothetical protein